MASFFDDLFGSLTGQQAVPTFNALSPQQGLAQAYGIAQGLAPQYAALNQAYQPIQTGLQLANEAQIYGPQANQLRQGLYQMGLDQLNMGENLSPALEADLTRKIMEARGQAGTGATQLGAESGIYELALQRELRGQQRRAEARGLTSMLPTSNFQYQPTEIPNVGGIYGDLQQQNAIQNDFENNNAIIKSKNTKALLNTAGRLLGAVGGGIAGSMIAPGFGTIMGAQAGSQIGGSLFGGGAQSQAGMQGGYNSILQGLVFNQMMKGGLGQGGIDNPYQPPATTFYE